MMSKEFRAFTYLKMKTQRLGRPFLTLFEITATLKETDLNILNPSQLTQKLIQKGLMTVKEEDITLGYRLKIYYVK